MRPSKAPQRGYKGHDQVPSVIVPVKTERGPRGL